MHGVLHRLVAGDVRSHIAVKPALVGMQGRLAIDDRRNDVVDRCLVGECHMERANRTAPLDQGDNRALAGETSEAALDEGTPLPLW